MSDPDYILDLSRGQAPKSDKDAAGSERSLRGRPWLAIRWTCCSAYSRIYRNPAGDAYQGRCPRCGKSVRVPVGEGGTSNRFFDAG